MLTYVARYRYEFAHNEHLWISTELMQSHVIAIYCPCPSSLLCLGPAHRDSIDFIKCRLLLRFSSLCSVSLCSCPYLILSIFPSPFSSASAMIDYFCDTFNQGMEGG